jgi:site-specific recombinase XerD
MDATRSRNRSGIVVLAEEFLEAAQAHKYSPRTVEIYGQALRDFGAFLDGRGVRAAQDVTPALVEAYRRHLQSRGFSPAGEETYCRAVKRFFDELERRQRVFENPFADSGPLRRSRRLVPVPTEAEVAALLAVPDVSGARGLRTRAILEVAYSTGARLEELARMRLACVDLQAGTVRIMGKGSKERVVPLGRGAVEWLEKYLSWRREVVGSDVGALWVGPKGKPIGSLAVGLSIRQCARKAGTATKITPHGLRRACATHMLGRGAHPVQLQMLLGHASLKHLSAYLRVRFLDLKAMHERSRLGQ